jgi:hypothetical protein
MITRRLRARLARGGEDRGSMAMVFLVIIVGVALGGLLLPVIISQTRSTTFDSTRIRSLDAAQAGIDMVVGQIRSTSGGGTYGDPGLLPCGPIAGTVTGTNPGSYTTTVAYYKIDPIANPGATKMICAPNYGPYDPATNTRTPKFALITSSGVAGAIGNGGSAGRTLVTTYVFKTDDTNVSGGVIRIFPDSSGMQYCMDAGSNPVAGSQIRLQVCSTANPPAAQQVFAYRTDLSIQLVSSAAGGNVGLCLDAKTPHSNGYPLYLDTCAPLGSATYDQEWSVDDNAHLEGAKSDKSGLDGYCINVAAQSAGQALTLQGCSGGTTSTTQTWVPDPRAGAGMAGAKYKQLVNFLKFGNCLDVTGQNTGAAYLILYTCKQNPNPTSVTWNQIFTPTPALGTKPTVTELITAGSDNKKYCLKSPFTLGGYVTVTTSGCTGKPATDPSNLVWTVNQVQDATGADLSYDLKYTIKDYNGNCLGLGASNDLHDGQYPKVVVTTCDGSTSQKWNADPSLSDFGLQNTSEK